MSLTALAVSAVVAALISAGFLLWHRWQFGRWEPRRVVVTLVSAFTVASFLLLWYAKSGSHQPAKKIVHTKGAGEVPKLVLPADAIDETEKEIATPDLDDIRQLQVLVIGHLNLASYNAVFSPLSPLGNNVLQDGQATPVDFYIGDPSEISRRLPLPVSEAHYLCAVEPSQLRRAGCSYSGTSHNIPTLALLVGGMS